MGNIHAAAKNANAIILNGDIFDFNWTTLTSLEAAVEEAEQWIESLCKNHPRARVCYVIGNHDNYKGFLDRLPGLCKRLNNFEFHHYSVHIGRSLFLHGDCATHPMTVKNVSGYRRTWYRGDHKGKLKGAIVDALVYFRIIYLIHLIAFPRRIVLRRVDTWIQLNHPDLLDQIDDVFFGHTHLPFSNVTFNGRCFHNTGSAIKTMTFNMMTFQYQDDDTE